MTLDECQTEVRSVRRPQKSLGRVEGGGNYPGRRLAQSPLCPRSRRHHYLSTNREDSWGGGGVLDWIGCGDGAIATCDHNSHAVS
jgi:hypothetical protein